MKILILGHGQHGKDTFAELMRDRFKLTFESSSRAALRAITGKLAAATGVCNPEMQYASRALHRDLWRDLIAEYNSPDKSRLAREILQHSDMYVGMRSRDEFDASRHLFDVIYFVDASLRMPPEPSMTIPYDPDTMIYIDNHGRLQDLIALVDEMKYPA